MHLKYVAGFKFKDYFVVFSQSYTDIKLWLLHIQILNYLFYVTSNIFKSGIIKGFNYKQQRVINSN